MKILLVNPPSENTVKEFIDDKGKSYVESDEFGSFPPLGALYILSYAKKKYPEHEYFFLDCVGEKLSYKELRERIDSIRPDIAGITSFTISLVDVVLTARSIRESNPDVHLCLGGHHPTAFPIEAASLPEFDSIIVGEGEYAFADLVDRIQNESDYTDIVGLYTKETIHDFVDKQSRDRRFLNHVIVPPAYVDDVDDIPHPDRSMISHINYNSIVGLTGKLATLITTRGCPYKCTFCDVPYKIYRQRDLDKVMDEIEHCISLGYEEFHFYDDLFNINAQKILDFCDALENRGLKIVWDFRGRVNGVTRESLARAKEVGLRMISFGVETGSDIGLKTLKKGSNIKQVKRTFKWCRELGIRTISNFMIGLPHEKSVRDIRDNVNFILELDPDYSQFAVLCLYPHTEVHRDAIKLGIAEAGSWERFSLDPLNNKDFKVEYWTQYMSESELLALQRESYKRFYFRIRYIARNVMNTASVHEFVSKTKGVLKLLNS